jgi:hypothetical protein
VLPFSMASLPHSPLPDFSSASGQRCDDFLFFLSPQQRIFTPPNVPPTVEGPLQLSSLFRWARTSWAGLAAGNHLFDVLVPAVRPTEIAITHPVVALAHSPSPPRDSPPSPPHPLSPPRFPHPRRRPVPFPRRRPLPQFLDLGTMAGVVR